MTDVDPCSVEGLRADARRMREDAADALIRADQIPELRAEFLSLSETATKTAATLEAVADRGGFDAAE